MKIRYVFETKQLDEMAKELEPIVVLIKENCIDYGGVDLQKLHWEDGRAVIDIMATLSPMHIMAALENGGYEGDVVVGVNNDTDRCVFKDDVNDMYLVGSVFLEFKNGRIEAEHGVADDEDCFATYHGF